jgi:hypothetical protein
MWWVLLILYLLMQIPLGIAIGAFIRDGSTEDQPSDSVSVSVKTELLRKKNS